MNRHFTTFETPAAFTRKPFGFSVFQFVFTFGFGFAFGFAAKLFL